MTDYRTLWSEGYSQTQQGRTRPPDTREMARFNRVYGHYLRGWLPTAPDAPILDIGCGAGLLLQFFKSRGYHRLLGLDASESQVALVRQQNLEAVQADALAFLKEEQAPFHLMTALDFIEHLTRSEALEFLSLAWEKLKPGGQLIFQTPNGESPWVGNVLYGDLTHERCYTPHLLQKMLERTGFEQIQYRPCGPAPVDPVSWLRCGLWAGITLGCRWINLIEGAVSSGIYTRVFLIRAVRPR